MFGELKPAILGQTVFIIKLVVCMHCQCTNAEQVLPLLVLHVLVC